MHLDLTRGDIKQHIRTLALPAAVGFFFHTLFNVTDTYFAGQISTQALAALSISFPIFFLIISIAGGMAEAVTAVVGNALGEEKPEEARHCAQNALLLGALLAIVLSLSGLLAAGPLMRLLGAEDTYLQEALGYIAPIIYASGLFVFTFFINALLNAMGDTVSFRNVLMASAAINVVLDWWFVREGMGVGGIALSTVIIEGLSVLYLAYRVLQTPLFGSDTPFRADGGVLRELVVQGIPPSANMALTAIGITIITYFASAFGQNVVAAYGIGMRVEQVLLMPLIGLNVAVLALVSQNSGARRYARIREGIDAAMGYALLLAIVGGGVLLGASDIVMTLFSDRADVIFEGARYLRIEALLLYPFALIFIYIAMLQGIKRPGFILPISIARQIVLPLMVLGGLQWYGSGVLSIWVGIAVIVTLSGIVTRWYARRELSRVEEAWQRSQR